MTDRERALDLGVNVFGVGGAPADTLALFAAEFAAVRAEERTKIAHLVRRAFDGFPPTLLGQVADLIEGGA